MSPIRPYRSIAQVLGSLTLCLVSHPSLAQDGVVRFEIHIKPIFESRCFRCHGGDVTEADLNLSDRNLVASHLEAGDPSGSELYDVLTNEDRRMPPEDEGGPLPAAEIALIGLWIEEGATWPEGVTVGETIPEVDATKPEVAEPESVRVAPSQRPLVVKIWAVHGYFHPAIVHFPIALLTIAALLVLLHWLLPGDFREFAFFLLVLGALSSIVACTMGWAFAPERSLGGGIFDADHKAFNHRWLGISVATLTSILSLVAWRARRSARKGAQLAWQVGILIVAALVGIAGHQGGELVYGEGIYERAFAKYFAPPEPASNIQPVSERSAGDE